ncbi:MAG: glycosyltransferase 87 family protein [Acidobacteriota bacterium]|nr:glycosyltransferase 87 family protein [Acidobacteriota bacterium]
MGNFINKYGFKALLALAFAAYLAASLLTIHKYGNVYQWDFKKDYYAARVQAEGLDFYDAPYLRHMAGSPVEQFYIYTPPSIWFYRLFTLFSFKNAYTLVLILKLLTLLGLVLLWQKEFRLGPLDPGFFIFLFFAFHYALTADFLSGNFALFEQAGLWAAFAFFLRKRYILFSLLIVLVSLFKILPLFFLVLLLFSKARRRFLLAASAGASFLLVQGLSYLLNPGLYRSFLHTLTGPGSNEWGNRNLSLVSFLKTVLDRMAGVIGRPLPAALAQILFAAAALAIVLISLRAYLRRRAAWGADADRMLVFLACLVFCLISPRTKDYSYLIVLLPGYVALRTRARDKGIVFLFLLLILDTPDSISALGLRPVAEYFWTYYPLFLTGLTWILYVGKPRGIPDAFPDSSPAPDRR